MSHPRVPVQLLKDPRHLLSLGFGSGLAPVAPGTFGTLAAIPFYLLYALWLPEIFHPIVVVTGLLLGIFICAHTTSVLQVHDHPAIVWDEFVGFFITMLFSPVSVWTILAGFILFRIFDIIKPWPISVIDSRLKGGAGVMLDDVLAGVYALMGMQLIQRLLPGVL